MSAQQVDFLIIGQGLAGSLLAFELVKHGKRVMVVDNDHYGSASYVAAGIINPITGHRLNLNKDFVQLNSIAKNFYRELEALLTIKIIRSVDQIRLIKNPGQREYFNQRLQEKDYQDILQTHLDQALFSNKDCPTAKIMQTSIVDTKALLGAIKAWLIEQGYYLNTHVDYSALNFKSDKVTYQQVAAHSVIFCEGYQAIGNPWLTGLPFKLSKGEVLTLAANSHESPMLSWGNWLIPHTNTSKKLGSNYVWNDLQLRPTAGVREKLLNSLANNTNLKLPVIDHEIGIRPTTLHRHAFIGPIRQRSRAYCFNGFGSKGCLTIPHHVKTLCDHFINQADIPEELSRWL